MPIPRLHKETSIFDESNTIGGGIDEAAKTASDYITEITSDGIMVHAGGEGPDDTQTPSGWHIADALELIKNGVTYIKLWLENNVAKLMLGRADSGHLLLDSDGVDVLDSSGNILSSFAGDGVVIGKPDEMRVSLQSDRLSFVDPIGAEAAYIAVNDMGFSVMYISRSVVVEDMQFGYDQETEKCRWKWYSRANGNMALKWMG